MSKKIIFNSALISAIVGFTAALAVCLVFFFFVYKPVQSNGTQQPLMPTETKTPPMQTPTPQTPTPEIKSSDVASLTLETIYKDFFEENSKCRKSYNELFGNDDGLFNVNSACRINLSFNRDGSATKSLEIRRWDKTAKENRVVEKTAWKTKITGEQFNELANAIVSNDVFKEWKDGMLINTSNSKITAKHSSGTREIMSNVDEKTTKFLPMLDSFKHLDGELKWEKAQ